MVNQQFVLDIHIDVEQLPVVNNFEALYDSRDGCGNNKSLLSRNISEICQHIFVKSKRKLCIRYNITTVWIYGIDNQCTPQPRRKSYHDLVFGGFPADDKVHRCEELDKLSI